MIKVSQKQLSPRNFAGYLTAPLLDFQLVLLSTPGLSINILDRDIPNSFSEKGQYFAFHPRSMETIHWSPSTILLFYYFLVPPPPPVTCIPLRQNPTVM